MISRVSNWAYGLYKRPEAATLGTQDGCQTDVPNCPDGSTRAGAVSNLFANFHKWLRLFVPRHHEAAKLWCKLCHKIDASYPPKEKVQPIDINNEGGMSLFDDSL